MLILLLAIVYCIVSKLPELKGGGQCFRYAKFWIMREPNISCTSNFSGGGENSTTKSYLELLTDEIFYLKVLI